MDERIKAYDVKMTKSYNNLLEEFGAIRAGRANPHVLDRITVEYYGTPTPGTDRGTKKRSGKRSEEKRRGCKSCCPQYQT